MALIESTPMIRRRIRAAQARSSSGLVTFGDLLGQPAPQGRMVSKRNPDTGQVIMVREDLPPVDPEVERRHMLVYLGLNLLGHIEDDPIADIDSSVDAGRSVVPALHQPSTENDRAFAVDMRRLIADLRAADRLLGFKQIDRLEDVLSQILD